MWTVIALVDGESLQVALCSHKNTSVVSSHGYVAISFVHVRQSSLKLERLQKTGGSTLYV